MADSNPSGEHGLPAGNFSEWMVQIQGAIGGGRGSDVPCGGCTACCTSSQFIHIGPDETETLSRIPAELLSPAPRLPSGHVVLGYDERGHCPMLIDDRCSIYEHRPKTCRTYDCRVFPAAGIEIDDPEKAPVARRAGRWRFGFPTQADAYQHAAVRAAAAFIDEHPGMLPQGIAPTSATQRAVLAIEIHDLFVHHDEETGSLLADSPDPEVVRIEVLGRLANRRSPPAPG